MNNHILSLALAFLATVLFGSSNLFADNPSQSSLWPYANSFNTSVGAIGKKAAFYTGDFGYEIKSAIGGSSTFRYYFIGRATVSEDGKLFVTEISELENGKLIPIDLNGGTFELPLDEGVLVQNLYLSLQGYNDQSEYVRFGSMWVSSYTEQSSLSVELYVYGDWGIIRTNLPQGVDPATVQLVDQWGNVYNFDTTLGGFQFYVSPYNLGQWLTIYIGGVATQSIRLGDLLAGVNHGNVRGVSVGLAGNVDEIIIDENRTNAFRYRQTINGYGTDDFGGRNAQPMKCYTVHLNGVGATLEVYGVQGVVEVWTKNADGIPSKVIPDTYSVSGYTSRVNLDIPAGYPAVSIVVKGYVVDGYFSLNLWSFQNGGGVGRPTPAVFIPSIPKG